MHIGNMSHIAKRMFGKQLRGELDDGLNDHVHVMEGPK